MNKQIRLSLVLLALAWAPGGQAGIGDFARGERGPEKGGGVSPAVYHLDQSRMAFDATVATESSNGNKLVDIEVLVRPGTPATATFSGVSLNGEAPFNKTGTP